MLLDTDQARIARHAANGVILDSNLLVVYLVGLHNEKDVPRFLPRSSGKGRAVCFPDDFILIKSLLLKNSVKHFVVTPQILAEISNLTFEHFPDAELKLYINRVLTFISLAKEEPSMKDELLKIPQLPHVGFADASIIKAAKDGKYLVLTEDLKCMAMLQSEGCCVYNINHLRTLRL